MPVPPGRTIATLLCATVTLGVLLGVPTAYASDPDPAAAAVAPSVADPPTEVVAAPADGALRVTWTAPSSDGGAALVGYDVAATPRTPGEPVVLTVPPDAPAAVVAGLANGTAYDVAVVAVNDVGRSAAGEAAGTPRGVPGAPVAATASAGDGSAVVRWSPPASDGGAPVESYVVTAVPSGTVATVAGAATAATVAPLANGAATSFTVAAVNAAGTGRSAGTASVTPRQPVRLVVRAQPAGSVVHGTPSTVGAALVTAAGVGVPGRRVDLLALIGRSTTWQRAASALTDAAGRVTLRATFPANSALRLRHPADAVTAPDAAVRSVAVATRVTAAPAATRIRVGQTVVVRGGIAPAHPVGSAVVLQRYVSGAWRTVAAGRMATTTTYAVTWRPPAAGAWPLRVVKPVDADHATGTSPVWRQQVDPETARDLARAILANPRITLATVHVAGVRDLAHARQNVVDVAEGRLARRSAYQNAPGGQTSLDPRLLRAVRRMGSAGTVTVSEIAGGSHARGSAHYYGRGLDVTWVNGRHVARGSGYAMAIDACRAFGASRVFSPSYDPYGGHHNHVHCEWS